MFRNLIYIMFLLLILILTGCNTLHNIKTVDIEIVVPAKVQMPAEYKTAALRYNNCIVAPNRIFSKYFIEKKAFIDSTNMDSIASMIYFQSFQEVLRNQLFFDTILEIAPFDYSDFVVVDSFNVTDFFNNDSSVLANTPLSKFAFPGLARLIETYMPADSSNKKQKIIDPEFGLYSKKELEQIADTTGVDLLFSLDFFGTIDGIIKEFSYQNLEAVYIFPYWNIYDLQKKELLFFYNKADTISWNIHKYNEDKTNPKLPPRKDAIITAAEFAGSEFAEYLVPHWIEVQRMYYHSGNVELSKTDKLIKQGEWIKAAEIWKANVGNKNKKIAAKSMFNLALANEMSGNLDAAIDWTVKSFQVFEQKNEIHYQNCMNYIQILGQRKLDIKTIDKQLNVGNINPLENKNE